MADEIRKEVIVDVRIENADNEKQVDTLTKRIVELRKETGALMDANKELAKSGLDNSKQYLDNTKQIEINKQKISENTASRKSLITTIVAEDGSIKSLQVRNRELIKQRNEITTATAAGRAQIALMNAEIDKNNETIKVNSSSLEKQRMNVGAYKKDVIKALKEINIGGINIGGVLDTLDDTNEALRGTVQGYKEAGIGAKLFGTAARTALTLTGIGILVAGLALVVAHWDDITDAIGLTSKAHTKFYEQAQKEIDAYNEKADYQRRVLQAIGASQKDLLTADLFKARQELFKQTDLLAKREEDLAKAQASGWITAMLKADDAQEAYENQKAVVEKLRQEIFLLNIELENSEESTGRNDPRGAAADKAKQQQEFDDAQELRDRRKIETNTELFELTKLHFELGKEMKEEEAEIHSRFNDRLVRETKKRIKDQADAEKKAAEQHRKLEQLKAEYTIGGLHLVTKERSQARIIGNAILQQDAIQETVVNTHAAAMAAYKALAPIPFVGPALGVAAALAAIAYGGARVAAIAGIQFADGGLVPGFAGGGLSGTKIMSHHGTPITRSNGDNRLATVRTNEVILNERQQAALGGDETFRRIGVPGFADGGFTGFSATNEAARRVEQAVEARNLMAMLTSMKVVLPIQDFEAAQAAKNSPITKATVL